MPGRRSSAGRARRRQSASEIDWRYAVNTTDVAVNGFIDPDKAIRKLKLHGLGLWSMQALLAFIMTVVAVVADIRYGVTYWYTNTEAGGKLRDMQYAWAFFNTICAICGVWVYLLWKEVMGTDRNQQVFRQKVHIWISYFTWAFGIWTSAVVLVSFENYSFSGNYPTELTCAFLGAVVCCFISDLWGLGKLCSLGTYTARLEEEWRIHPHDPDQGPQNLMENAPEKNVNNNDSQDRQRDERRRSRHERRESTRDSKSGIEVSINGKDPEAGFGPLPPAVNPETDASSNRSLVSTNSQQVGEDEVLLPHAFERLWINLEQNGGFQTRITSPVSQTKVVRHLNDRGFQVVAAGTIGTLMRVLFCAKEATVNGTGEWFLAEFLVDEAALTLGATFKSKKPALVPIFVQSFMLHQLYTIAS